MRCWFIAECRWGVFLRRAITDAPALNDHMGDLLKELVVALEINSEQTIPETLAEASPAAHGLQRLEDEFDIEEVVAEYNIMRFYIHDLATEHDVLLQGRPFHVINRIFDHAIGEADTKPMPHSRRSR